MAIVDVMAWARSFGRFLLERIRGGNSSGVNAVIDASDPVKGAIRDAHLLMAFAAQSHRSIKEEKVKALADAVASIETAKQSGVTPTPVQTAALWLAYDALATDMAPLSAHSIRSSANINDRRFPSSLMTPTAYNAAATVVVFIACLALQGFWVAGKELIDRADTIEADKSAVQQKIALNAGVNLRNQARARTFERQICAIADCERPEGRRRSVGVEEPAQAQLASLQAELSRLQGDAVEASILGDELKDELLKLNEKSRPLETLLRKWHDRAREVCSRRVIEFMCPVDNPKPEDIDDKKLIQAIAESRQKVEESQTNVEGERVNNKPTIATRLMALLPTAHEQQLERDLRQLERDEQRLILFEADRFRSVVVEVRIIVANIGTYLIALVMGILGALAYLLRTLSQQLKDYTYVPISVSTSIVRVCLGAIAGVFGSLLAPGGDAALKSLPPLFVPFAFGYGIEILFSLLDKVVRTFTQADSAQQASAQGV